MKQYHELCEKVLTEGMVRTDRTGTGTISIFSHQMEFDMKDGFPLMTTKDMTKNFELFKGEMLAFLAGATNANVIAEEYGFKIWRKWALDETGDLGRIYGAQWRGFRGVQEYIESISDLRGNIIQAPQWKTRMIEVDQIEKLIQDIKEDPFSRRLLVSAWNPAEIDKMALPPCHWSFECYVDGENMDTLNLKLHQRSCDVFLGVPFNIGEYALLLHMLAQVTGLKAGKFVHDMTNVHIYLNHVDQVKEQLKRKPLPLPKLVLNRDVKDIFEFKMEDIMILGYEHHGKMTGVVSV